MYKIEPKKRIEKIIYSGNVIEYIKYAKPIPVEHIYERDTSRTGVNDEKLDCNVIRARQEIRRIIWCNQTQYSKFVTLTYKDTCLDYDCMLYDFKQFIKKLRRRGYVVPYVWVSEHQKERGLKEGNEGSLHIHAVLFTDAFISNNVISECWGLGFTKINAIEHVNNLAAYVCKYLSKEEFNEYGKHSYHISRGLKKPIVVGNDGYAGDFLQYTNPEFFENVKFTWAQSTEFSYLASDGSKITNSIIYKQGVLKK